MSSQGQLGFTFEQAPSRRIWRVADLVGAVRTTVERSYTDVWVEGEISNFRPAESGHYYFTLKDGDAQLRIVMFRSQARLLRFKPENGLQIIARGRITIYDARGELQLTAEYLEPVGAGALQLAFEQLKNRLAAEGLFDADRKKPIPQLPRRIGIVTSPRGAALHDMLNILARRHENVGILIYPAQVQGDGASSEVAAGVKYFNRAKNVNVIIVARGGGSVEDLAAFNDEGLARTISNSALPVISAVGHETDFTICDFVADLRAPTPSAAAELVIESKHRLAEHLAHLRQRLDRATRYHLVMAKGRLTELAQHGAFVRIQDFLGRREQRLDELVFHLAASFNDGLRQYHRRLEVASARVRHFDFRRTLAATRTQLGAATHTMVRAMRARIAEDRARLNALSGKLDALSPVKILDRGYALVFDRHGALVKDAGQIAPGDHISARVSRGTFNAEVKETNRE
ncbi:MAG TPA: exodeoxyribonuclease VII large subunit [Candidatus Limnocylindrales bacterium]|jgi:exodeoxyribonuclease VII large subunit|nr:exodeoxyribonuclease VII large subunit [Candidatus Limnocylindrales bacterium]